MKTPSYVFYESIFAEQVAKVKGAIGDIPLCYSIKANPFLLNCLPEGLDKIEVCSPGELSICQKLEIAPERIIYSGVMKETCDIERAVEYNVGIMTAESPLHVKLENQACLKAGLVKKVILRLSSGNQFGMSAEDIKDIIAHRGDFEGLNIIGIHFYSGTQKKQRAIDKDFVKLESLLVALKEDYGFEPELVEYGPGMGIDYFGQEQEDTDKATLMETAEKLKAFAKKYPLGIEMGRYLASDCGVFLTEVKDIKSTGKDNYVICDGGMHHLRYYGQTMAMLVPPMAQAESAQELLKYNGRFPVIETLEEPAEGKSEYCICGSLCTVADVLIRNVALDTLKIGDCIGFGKCGAYSVTEGSSLFLSRDLPAIYLAGADGPVKLLRDVRPSYEINLAD